MTRFVRFRLSTGSSRTITIPTRLRLTRRMANAALSSTLRRLTPWPMACRPTWCSRPTPASCSGLIVAQQVLEDAAGGDFAHIDKSRISVILGATGTTELVVHLGARLQRPIWLNALRQNGIAEDEAQAICNRIADSYVPWTEASFPGLLGNVIAGRIANKFRPGRHQLRRRRGLRQLAVGAVDGAERTVLAAVRHGDRRRRGHAQRHPHVHVL